MKIYNNKNFVVNWAPIDLSAIYNDTVLTSQLNMPLTFLTPGYTLSNPTSGINSSIYPMPTGNLRYVAFESSVAGVVFRVTGILNDGTLFTETVTCIAAATTYYTGGIYAQINAIVPITVPSDADVQIGYAGGETAEFRADVWNKVNNYSIAITDITGTMTGHINYSIDGFNYFPFVVNVPPMVITPSTFTNPFITENQCSFDIHHCCC